jgi:hypothetical protein
MLWGKLVNSYALSDGPLLMRPICPPVNFPVHKDVCLSCHPSTGTLDLFSYAGIDQHSIMRADSGIEVHNIQISWKLSPILRCHRPCTAERSTYSREWRIKCGAYVQVHIPVGRDLSFENGKNEMHSTNANIDHNRRAKCHSVQTQKTDKEHTSSACFSEPRSEVVGHKSLSKSGKQS